MKIVVDEYPNTPKECLFAKIGNEGYVCTLNIVPGCLCSVCNCGFLISYNECKMFD